MSRTRRIYNRIIRKCHRNDLTQESIVSILEMNEWIKSSLKYAVHSYGFPYHPFLQICMGRCGHCRDHSKDQHHLRKIRKVEFMWLVRKEVINGEEC